MTTKHTPGPWAVQSELRRGQFSHHLVVGQPGGWQDVAHVLGSHNGQLDTVAGIAHMDANARLIAAAPELLTAAIEAVSAMESIWQAKSRDDDFIYDQMGSELSAGFFSLRDAIAKATGAA